MTAHLLAVVGTPRRGTRKGSALFGLPQMEKANLELELKFGDGGNYKPPPQPDVMALWKKCVVAEEVRDYSALSDRDWRNAPWCLWLRVGDVIESPRFLWRLVG